MSDALGPRMAVVIPVLNEVEHIGALLADLDAQDLPASAFDVIVLDGGSDDGTKAILEDHAPSSGHGFLVVENPNKTVPHARNLAMHHLADDVELLIELIGHVRISSDHLSTRRKAWASGLQRHGDRLVAMGVRVLGPERSRTTVEGWVDGALRSRFGRGGGQFAEFATPGLTKVPAFATHRRQAIEDVGGWNPEFATSQDSDLSMRLLVDDAVIERDPAMTVRMHRRETLRGHWRMAVRYGYWRGRLLRSHPGRADPREFAPLFGALLCAVLFATVPSMVVVPVGAYIAVLLGAGLASTFVVRRATQVFGVPLCLIMLHSGFSLGLLRSLMFGPPKKRDR